MSPRRIPRLLAISPPGGPALRAWLAAAPALVAAGVDGLLLRVLDEAPPLAGLRDLGRAGVPVLVHARTPGLRAPHVHLPAAADPARWRPLVSGLLGQSCHDPAGLGRAAAAGCDYATLSPIFPPGSKPGDRRPPLGPGALADAPLPVLALGGIDPSRVTACLAAGAHGVAGIGTFGDPERIAAMARALAGAAPGAR